MAGVTEGAADSVAVGVAVGVADCAADGGVADGAPIAGVLEAAVASVRLADRLWLLPPEQAASSNALDEISNKHARRMVASLPSA
ncbi:MAG TPA: hypothetical protein VFD32_13740 [Dehalococcoidia bacterium]|nr:hypothetical protein [Dehalococcoidia bacterium]